MVPNEEDWPLEEEHGPAWSVMRRMGWDGWRLGGRARMGGDEEDGLGWLAMRRTGRDGQR